MTQDATPIADLLDAALRWHAAGQADAAQILAQRILARAPSHPEALALLSRLRPAAARPPESVRGPQVQQAAQLNNRGVAESGRGDSDAALASYAAALALDPNHVEAWSNRGNSLMLRGRVQEALECYDRAIALRPDYGAAYANRGWCRQQNGRIAEAVADYDVALRLVPELVGTMVNRGNALLALGRPEAALADHRQAAAREPGLREAVNGMGAALADLHRLDEALAQFEHALALSPGFVEAMVNRAAALHRLGRFQEALATQDAALALRDTDAVAHFNRGTILMDMQRQTAALDSFARAQAIDPTHIDAHWNEALCRLALGDYAQGWRKHEWGWANGQRGARRDYGGPAWLGEPPIAGATLLLHAEQGMGDTLQFCRYANLAADLGTQVILEVQPNLVRLLRRMAKVHTVVATGEALPQFDRHTALLSAPLAFGTSLETIPGRLPYLQADPQASASWGDRLSALPRPWIGLVWAGDPRPDQPAAHRVDARRSMRLAQMQPLAQAPRASFISLQKGAAASQAAAAPAGLELFDWTDELHDFADTADLVAALDLVISVDTSVAHLAGGLGIPVWVLSRHNGCWRWLLDRADSPWYPSARIFRQPAPGDWASVMAEVVAALHHFPHSAPTQPGLAV